MKYQKYSAERSVSPSCYFRFRVATDENVVATESRYAAAWNAGKNIFRSPALCWIFRDMSGAGFSYVYVCVRRRIFPACAIEKCFSRVELLDCRGCGQCCRIFCQVWQRCPKKITNGIFLNSFRGWQKLDQSWLKKVCQENNFRNVKSWFINWITSVKPRSHQQTNENASEIFSSHNTHAYKKFSDKNLKISNFKPVDSKTKKPAFNFIQFSTIVFGQSIKQILKNVINVTTLHDNK